MSIEGQALIHFNDLKGMNFNKLPDINYNSVRLLC